MESNQKLARHPFRIIVCEDPGATQTSLQGQRIFDVEAGLEPVSAWFVRVVCSRRMDAATG